MLGTILNVGTSFLLSLFLTPLAIAVAKSKKIYDVPDARKSHQTPTPLMGGVAIWLAATLPMIIFAHASSHIAVPVLAVGATAVALMGLIDDIITLSARHRMIILFCVALIVFFGGIQFYFDDMLFYDPLVVRLIFPVFIIFWVVGITNAINFSDGLDGLASYLALISTISFAIIFSFQGRNTFILPIALALCGAIAGFIPYNRSPAMVFMGDAGSMFIGFMLSLLSITSVAHETTLLSVIVPIFILFVPILDMTMSMLRRLIVGKPIMKPDKMHFHHQLNARLHNHLAVVIALSLAQIVFAGMGVFIFIYKLYELGWVIMAALVATASAYTAVEAGKARRIKSKPLRQSF